jgi:hypothetical protein
LKDSDSEDEAQDDSKTIKTNKTNKKGERKSRSKKNSNDFAWLQENEDEDPLDLLDPMAIKHVLATKPLTKEQIEKKKDEKAKNRGFKQTNDGRLVIDDDSDEDSDNDMKSKKSTKSKKKNNNEIDEMMDTLSISKKSYMSTNKKKKRALDHSDDSDDDAVMDSKSSFRYRAGGSGIHRKIDKNNKQADVGFEYKAKVKKHLKYFILLFCHIKRF